MEILHFFHAARWPHKHIISPQGDILSATELAPLICQPVLRDMQRDSEATAFPITLASIRCFLSLRPSPLTYLLGKPIKEKVLRFHWLLPGSEGLQTLAFVPLLSFFHSSVLRWEAVEAGLVLHPAALRSERLSGGGASGLTLRHDGRCNGLLALPS